MRRVLSASCVLAAALLAAGALSGCGADDAPSTSGPASDPPSSASDTPSTTLTTSPTAQPATRSPSSTSAPIEDQPPVKAVRAFAAAQGTDINNADKNYTASKPLSTARAQARLGDFGNADIDKALYYPGPIPLTPLAVRGTGARARVVTCTWTAGWGQDRTTHDPVEQRTIRGLDFVMVRTGGTWKVDDVVVDDTTDCSDVNVRGIPW